jgi:hypothetical protein
MASKDVLSIRISPELKGAIRDAVQAKGFSSETAFVVSAIRSALGIESSGPLFSGQSNASDLQELTDRIQQLEEANRAIVMRLDALGTTKPPTPRAERISTAPAHTRAASPIAAALDPEGWLSTRQAYELYAANGGTNSFTSFKTATNYESLGFETDPIRRAQGKGSRIAYWLRPLQADA